jgi:predicted DNA-binding transcriptional regulator YafY
VSKIHKIERLMNLVLLIKNNPGIPVKKIAESFNISERTAYRDFITLSLAGFPVYSATGKGGGYFIEKDCFLQPLRFTCEEAASLLIAAKFFQSQKGFPYQQDIRLALAKIEGILETKNKEYMQKIDKKISVYLGKLKDYQSYDAIFQKVNKAIMEKKRVKMTYYAISRNEENIRNVDPFHLMFRGGFWYLIAFCHLRNEIKMFRIDRIKDLQLTENNFQVPADFSLASYMGKSWQVVRGEGETYQVEIKIFAPASRWVKEEKRHPTQRIIILGNETILFKAEVSSLTEIKRWVLQLGSCAEVIYPEELKEEVVEEIKKMRRRYRGK